MSSAVNIPLGTFQPGASLLHRLDPRTKIVALAIVLSAVIVTWTWYGLLVTSTLTLMAGSTSRDPNRMLHDAWSFRFFYIFTILMHLIFDRGGEVVLKASIFTITFDGLNNGLFFSTKIALLGMLSGLFSRTTHPSDLSKGIERLLPSRGAFARLIGRPGITVGLAMKMLPTILAEAERIRTAQIARGLKLNAGGIVTRIKNLLPLIGPLLTTTLHRGDEIHDAMVSRGFDLNSPRTSYADLTMTGIDWLVLLLAIAASSVSILL